MSGVRTSQKGMTMFKTTKLCPFCASDKNRLVELDADNHKEYAVMCENCGAFGPNDLGEWGAVEMWDLRREQKEIQQNAPQTCFNCGGPVNVTNEFIICQNGCGGPVVKEFINNG